MKFLAHTSAIGIGMAGILIFVCWILAARDNTNKFPGGCIRLFSNNIRRSGDLKRYYMGNQNAFAILVSFGVICGILWIVTAALAFVKATYYLLVGIITTIMFICSFVPLVEIIRFMRQCDAATNEMNIDINFKDEEWKVKRVNDSYEIFWGTSIACFILAAYQIGCAITMVYEENRQGKKTARLETERALADPAIIQPPDPDNKEKPQESEEQKTVNPTPEKVKKESIKEPEKAIETFLNRPLEQQVRSIYVKKGEVELPKESPLPDISNPEFSLSDT